MKDCISNANIYLVSYPKCGRTWLRALIGKYLTLKYNLPQDKMLELEYITKQASLLITTCTHDESHWKDGKLKEGLRYQQMSWDKKFYTNKKVIFMKRDIKDVLVSAYFQATKRNLIYNDTLSKFIRDDRYGVLKVLTFYDMWEKAQNIPKDFLLVEYEDLHQKTELILKKVLKFIGENNPNENYLQQSINFGSFENLKEIERKNKLKSPLLQAKTKNDPESFKVRQGKIGGYTQYLNQSDVDYINNAISSFR